MMTLRIHVVFLSLVYLYSIFPFVGNMKWTLKEKPAIFGTNIHLVCHLPNKTSCCKDDRKWNVGYQYILVIINGLSYNTSKYKEDLNVKDRVSVLTVFSLSEQDVNIPYECVYGYRKFRSTLELTKDVFEYHPTENLPVVPEIRGNNMSFYIQFKKVFPKPLCRASLGMQNLSSFLFVTVRRNHLFYESTLTFIYSSSEKACKDSVIVICTVGKTELTVVDHKICSSSEAKDSSLSSIIVINVVVLVAVILIVTIVIVIVCVRRNQCPALKNWRKQDKDTNTEELDSLQHTLAISSD